MHIWKKNLRMSIAWFGLGWCVRNYGPVLSNNVDQKNIRDDEIRAITQLRHEASGWCLASLNLTPFLQCPSTSWPKNHIFIYISSDFPLTINTIFWIILKKWTSFVRMFHLGRPFVCLRGRVSITVGAKTKASSLLDYCKGKENVNFFYRSWHCPSVDYWRYKLSSDMCIRCILQLTAYDIP